MEPVLSRYSHVFHLDDYSPFKGTDLVKHQIVTGDARPIRKAPYRVPFALRQEMETQVKDMLKNGHGYLRAIPNKRKWKSLTIDLLRPPEVLPGR
jgi:hypothetical protein